MPAKYFTILTNIGSALHANAQIQQTKVPWTHMALGDGGGVEVQPDQKQTGLVREVHRLPITAIDPHPANPNWIVVEAVVPNNVGGWTVRETAIFGGTNSAQCIAVGNYPASYKPVLAQGAVREMVMRMIVEITSTATVNLVIDPAVAIASRSWVEAQVATDEKRGFVELATLAETDVGLDPHRAVTPEGLRSVLPRTAFNIADGASINDLNLSGLYFANGVAGGPLGTSKFFGWIRHSSITPSEYAFQEAFDVIGRFWRRYQNEGQWSNWAEVQTKDQTDFRFEMVAEELSRKENSISEGGPGTYWAGEKEWKKAADIPVRSATNSQSGVVVLGTIEDVYSGDGVKAIPPSVAGELSAASEMLVFSKTGVTQWDVPEILKSGAKKPYVTVIGAGGGCISFGGTPSRGAGGAGSAEGYVDLKGVPRVAITVGAASTGNGGTSSFGSYMSATGGGAGALGDGNLIPGGVGIGGTWNRQGQYGGAPDNLFSGEGGASPYSQEIPRSRAGVTGSFPGGGASSGSVDVLGAGGLVIVRW